MAEGVTRREVLAAAIAGGTIAACNSGTDGLSNTTDTGAAPDAAAALDATSPDAGFAEDARAEDAPAEDAAAADAETAEAGIEDAGTDPTLLPESMQFPLGVASGDATTEGALLWTRYTGNASLQLIVFESTSSRAVHSEPVTPSSGGYVSIDVRGLIPGARYGFTFVERDLQGNLQRSPIGAFRTATPAGSLEPLVIGAVSCTWNPQQPRTLERAGARSDLDLFLFLGDTTYADGARTLADYRDKWGQNLSKAGYRGVRSATSLLATWDDHEVDNNWDPETIDAQQLQEATAAFFEHQPLRRDALEPNRIWRSSIWGSTVEVFVLDSRSERRPSTRGQPDSEYISRAQMDWLKNRLSSSPCVFKIVMSSVPIGDLPGLILRNDADRWGSYPNQRTEILQFVDHEAIGGVIWLSGDIHCGAVGRISTSGPGSSALEVIAGPGAQFPNPAAAALRPPQYDFGTAQDNYAALHLDPNTRTLRLVFHDQNNALLSDRSYIL